MSGSHDLNLVILSIIIGIAASYVALDLAARIGNSRGRTAQAWLLGGALSMGAGIWSMHFIGMLAFSLPTALSYDFFITLASLMIAVAVSGFALHLASGASLSRRRLEVGGLIMGIGICAMHYTGMAAMRMSPPVQYDGPLFAASVLIAIGAATAALYLTFTLRSASGRSLVPRRLLAALAMGIAISGMHYTGMAAIHFPADSICTVRNGLNLQNETLGYMLGFAMLLLMMATAAASLFDQHASVQTAQMLRELEAANQDLRREIETRERIEHSLRVSEEQFRSAFEETPTGMILIAADGRWLQVNPALCSMLGYSAEELLSLGSAGVSHPEDAGINAVAMADQLSEQRKTLRMDKRYKHKDGHTVYTQVYVSALAANAGARYVVQIEDTSESKKQHRQILQLNRMHTMLSAVGSVIVRVRERQELFRQACRLAVEQGGFRFCWIGTVGKLGEITPVASHGIENGYLGLIGPALAAASSEGGGPSAIMFREHRPYVSNDIASDPHFSSWRDAALQRGYRSMAAVPLIVREQVAGCFDFYSETAGFFDEAELNLLSSLARDISYALEFITRSEELDYLAYYDPLTGLANRSLFLDRINDHILSAKTTGLQLAVVVVDLNQFKAINDAWGQAVGDRLLIGTAERLGKFVRSPLQLARISGDRFAIVIPDVETTAVLGRNLLERALTPLEQPLSIYGQELRVTAKAGVSVFPLDGEDAESLFKNAESALKNAKRSAERLCFYTRHLSTNVRQRMDMENRLRHAITGNEFLLHYQPKVDLHSGRVCGVEALIRWDSAEMGLVPPAQFIPLLEETGLIREVGQWIFRDAARVYRDWSGSRASAPRIAVNVSPLQLQHPDFVSQVRETLGRADGTHGIDIEVTESLMLNDIESTIATLHQLRSLGVRIAIDDFGTGYSSLAYLARLPVDALKIDRSFIVRMGENSASVELVATIINMAHSLGMKVIAEGVDSAEQLRFLRMLKCDEVQGFLFSKPVPYARLESVVQSLRLTPGVAADNDPVALRA